MHRFRFHRLAHDLVHEVHAGRLGDEEACARIASHIQATLDCTHVSFWEVSGTAGRRRMRRGVSFDGRTGEVVAQPLEFEEHGGGYFDTLARRGCYVSADTFADPHLVPVRERVLVPYRIHALLSSAWRLRSDAIGVLSCTHQHPRAWSSHEVTALRRCAGVFEQRHGPAARVLLASGN